jgi:hypothetical protein
MTECVLKDRRANARQQIISEGESRQTSRSILVTTPGLAFSMLCRICFKCLSRRTSSASAGSNESSSCVKAATDILATLLVGNAQVNANSATEVHWWHDKARRGLQAEI